MEGYTRHICQSFHDRCVSIDDIYECIKDCPQYQFNLNENGKLHSEYTGSYYKPAIIETIDEITTK